MTPYNKVFGIGFHRTATTSLDAALNLLGISSVHAAFELFDDVAHPVLRAYDAFTDNPIPLIYRTLDEKFPGSKFILTVRETDEWLASVEWLFTAGRIKYKWNETPVVDSIHRALYGLTDFDEKVFRETYQKHHEQVLDYFADRRADLLIIDIAKGEGWDHLCPFLGKPVPENPFPRQNQAAPLQQGHISWSLHRCRAALRHLAVAAKKQL